MKASELIETLKNQIEKYGDAEVYVEQGESPDVTHERAVRSVAMRDPQTGKASLYLIQDNAAALEMG